MFKNEASYVSLHNLGKEKSLGYQKTYDFPGTFINASHEKYATSPKGRMGIPFIINLGIDGYLLPDDALKIYELAYFCKGNILELGTFRGLSTSIIAQALADAGSDKIVETDDIDAKNSSIAQKTIESLSLAKYVKFNVMDATEFCDLQIVQGKRYDFIFIDHWHGYEATYSAAMRAKKLLTAGGFCLFHDYSDPANADPKGIYGVYRAAHDSMLCDERFDFYGKCGSTALFRKVS